MLKCELQILAGNERFCGGALSVTNITAQEKNDSVRELDSLYRSMMRIFDALYYYRGREKKVQVLLTAIPSLKPGATLTEEQWLYLTRYVHPEDRKRFMKFLDTENIVKKAATSPHNVSASHFRMKDRSGQYQWKELVAMVIGNSEDRNILLGAKDTVLTLETPEEREKLLSQYMSSWHLDWRDEKEISEDVFFMDTLRREGDFKYFWKDKNRRFLGASNAFLRYYGFPNDTRIRGKTDEEMGWHLGGNTYKEEEERVLTQGDKSYNVKGKCIIQGKLHTIRATKVPVYQGNEIVGLAGWFVDLDDEARMLEKDSRRSFTDDESRFLSTQGIIIAAEHFHDALEAAGTDYVGILLEIPAIEEFGKEYGTRSRGKLVREIDKRICRAFSEKAVIGRKGMNSFLIFQNAEGKEELQETLDHLSADIGSIHSADGCPCTLFIRTAAAYGSEVENVDEMRALLLRRAKCRN